ncbi:MFS transporter [Streptomyces sp. So13.3]|uniref:MFS transporter n=1 Tax=Streptomyces TaxID=1883 RepID=UPI0011058F58|nr:MULTISPECIES: MFS transporter [Streptomyces]MCZ4103387.1 MFS transporter [Streptomyces sp. H39-C1]QNA76893.1 MFS transporter [Streptomyces sp. So13.3]
MTAARRTSPGSQSRDFWLYWSAGTSDALGTQASGLVLPLLLLGLGSSPGTVGVLASVSAIGGLLAGPPASVLADRRWRRGMMVGSALVAAGAMGAIAAAAAWGRPSLLLLCSAALVERVATACYEAAARGTLVTVVAPVHYPRAIARLEAGEQGALVAGPALGGLLFPLARWLPFLMDALSYVFSALCVRAIRADLNPHQKSEDSPPRFTEEFLAGLRFVRNESFLRFVLLWTAGVNGLLTALYYGAVFSIRGQGSGTASTGLVLALSGAAGLVGAAAAPRLARRIPAARIVIAASWTMVPVAAGLAFATHAWVYGLLLGSVSLTVPAVAVVLHSRAVLVTPDQLQSRVGTTLDTACGVASVLAPAAAGLLTDHLGSTRTALLCAAGLAVLAAYATATAARRFLPSDHDPDREPGSDNDPATDPNHDPALLSRPQPLEAGEPS